MSQIIASNSKVLSQLNTARAIVNGACSFRLFTSPLTVTPGNILSNFVEAAFPGYVRINTAGKFGSPLKVIDGLYECSSTPFELTCTDDTDQQIAGWYIWSASTWIYAALFPEPIPALNGTTFSIIVQLQESSMSRCDC